MNSKWRANVGAPQVVYRETITKAAEIDYTHKTIRWFGAICSLNFGIRAKQKGKGYEFKSEIVGGLFLKNTSRALKKVFWPQTTGIIAGFPVCGLQIRLTDGAYHDVDSSRFAGSEIAAAQPSKKGCKKQACNCSEQS